MKIIDYEILSSGKKETLSMVVKAYLKNAWQPYKRPYLDKNGRQCQAMVKYEEIKGLKVKKKPKEQAGQVGQLKGSKQNED